MIEGPVERAADDLHGLLERRELTLELEGRRELSYEEERALRMAASVLDVLACLERGPSYEGFYEVEDLSIADVYEHALQVPS